MLQRWTVLGGKHTFSSSICPEVSTVQALDQKTNLRKPYMFVLWPSFGAQKSFLSKEYYNNGVHLFGDVTFVFFLPHFSLLGVSCDNSGAPHLTFPRSMTLPVESPLAWQSCQWNRNRSTITSTKPFLLKSVTWPRGWEKFTPPSL